MAEHDTKKHGSGDILEVDIRPVAELIFDVLYRQGDMDLEHLRRQVHHKAPVFDWALGWLVGKGDIEIISTDGSFRVQRNPPTPVVIPVRGN